MGDNCESHTIGKCTSPDCPKFRCPICHTSIVPIAGEVCETCSKVCDNCGKSVHYPYESLHEYKGSLLCEDCLAFKRNLDLQEQEDLYTCDNCGVRYTLQVPFNGRTICEDCCNANQTDLDTCESCQEIFLPSSPEQSTCRLCTKRCVKCGSFFYSDDNSAECDICKESVICTNCGDICMKIYTDFRGYCENCAARNRPPECIIPRCHNTANANGICEEHESEYTICTVCNSNFAHIEMGICDTCINDYDG